MAGHTELGWDILAGIHGVLFNMEEALFHWSLHIKKKLQRWTNFPSLVFKINELVSTYLPRLSEKSL
jgi:hypothetical protein